MRRCGTWLKKCSTGCNQCGVRYCPHLKGNLNILLNLRHTHYCNANIGNNNFIMIITVGIIEENYNLKNSIYIISIQDDLPQPIPLNKFFNVLFCKMSKELSFPY